MNPKELFRNIAKRRMPVRTTSTGITECSVSVHRTLRNVPLYLGVVVSAYTLSSWKDKGGESRFKGCLSYRKFQNSPDWMEKPYFKWKN